MTPSHARSRIGWDDQEKIKAGATIGELVNIDAVFRTMFSYQNKALEHG